MNALWRRDITRQVLLQDCSMCSQSVASIVWTLARAREAYYIDTRLCKLQYSNTGRHQISK